MTGETFLRPKGKGRGIMVSDLLPFGRLRPFTSLQWVSQFSIGSTGLTETEAVEIFVYGRSSDGYGMEIHFFEIGGWECCTDRRGSYPGYSSFMFDNATSSAVYAKDALCTGDIARNRFSTTTGSTPLEEDKVRLPQTFRGLSCSAIPSSLSLPMLFIRFRANLNFYRTDSW